MRASLRSEGYKGRACPFKDEMALDLDNVEKLLKQGKSGVNQDETVDFVVCLEKDLLLLVEAKLSVDDAASISTNEICGKIRHSRDMLQACDNFVHFEKTVKQDAINTCVSLQLQPSFCVLRWAFRNAHAFLRQQGYLNEHIYASNV